MQAGGVRPDPFSRDAMDPRVPSAVAAGRLCLRLALRVKTRGHICAAPEKKIVGPPVSEAVCGPALSVSAGNGKIKRPLPVLWTAAACHLFSVAGPQKVYKKYGFL